MSAQHSVWISGLHRCQSGKKVPRPTTLVNTWVLFFGGNRLAQTCLVPNLGFDWIYIYIVSSLGVGDRRCPESSANKKVWLSYCLVDYVSEFDEELDELDETVSSSTVVCAASCCAFWLFVCSRPLPLLKVWLPLVPLERSLGVGILPVLCVFCAICFRVNSVTSPVWTDARVHEGNSGFTHCLRPACAHVHVFYSRQHELQ